MVDATWEEINRLIHKGKGSLELAYKIELNSQNCGDCGKAKEIRADLIKLRRSMGMMIEQIEDIILKQKNGD